MDVVVHKRLVSCTVNISNLIKHYRVFKHIIWALFRLPAKIRPLARLKPDGSLVFWTVTNDTKIFAKLIENIFRRKFTKTNASQCEHLQTCCNVTSWFSFCRCRNYSTSHTTHPGGRLHSDVLATAAAQVGYRPTYPPDATCKCPSGIWIPLGHLLIAASSVCPKKGTGEGFWFKSDSP